MQLAIKLKSFVDGTNEEVKIRQQEKKKQKDKVRDNERQKKE